MPAPVLYAHRLMARQAQLRKTRQLDGLLPDAKSQVTLRYGGGRIDYADTIVVSTQHRADLPLATLREAVMEEMIKPVIPARWLTPPPGC
jgi:S-adenosylmethionine synthetase